MTTEIFDFAGVGGYTLSGRLEVPQGAVKGWAIVAHCFTCGKDNLATTRLARGMADLGIGVLRFDFAGLGASGGDFADVTLAGNVEDIAIAARALNEVGKVPSLLVGHSLGGSAALAAASKIPNVKAVATIGSPFDVKHVLHQFDTESLVKLLTKGEAEVVLGGQAFTLRRSFATGLRQFNHARAIETLDRPLLVIHASHDTSVSVDHATQIFATAKHPKTFVSLDNADHLLSDKADVEYVAAIIATWAARYLSR